jgi:heptosyltransferase II
LSSQVNSSFDPRNILVIDFGQMGDVVLSLPALAAIRKRFPAARITIAVGKAGSQIIELCGYGDEILAVDRVGLRDGSKLVSIARVFKLVKDVRRAHFDFVIDLHSLPETNLLGFLSGAPQRLFSRRPPRSLDLLANFRPRPPVEEDHRTRHLIDRYLDVLLPLGVSDADRQPHLRTTAQDDAAVAAMLRKSRADAGAPLVGLFPGAGHPTRRWPIEKFAELADYLKRNDGVRVVLFLGPEESSLLKQKQVSFPSDTVIFDKLSVRQLAAAQARLAVFVTNDTGPMHIAAAVGTPLVVLLNKRAPDSYLPLGERHRFLSHATIEQIPVEDVYLTARAVFASERAGTLFSR